MYVVIELQTGADGQVASLVHSAASYNQGLSIYHQILASAAISEVPIHACVMLKNTGYVVKSEFFDHTRKADPDEMLEEAE